ncbi:MAG: branched-chain amino acid ABC transporter permease [Anaeromyxobacter sp.]|nr:branched-chain amino acid ABC transporter permease [Anaeromyxobacter sp.]MBL0274746.1 branched-chain amino acid ABC transporter permease [Anaeromyxobacter sp.]
MSLLRSLRPPRGFSMPAFLTYLAVIILVALVPQVTRKPLILHMWIMVFLAISQGAAWNVIGGYTGQYSVGHAAYFGIGAYTTMMLLELHQIAPWYGIGLAIINAVLLAAVIGSITFRLRGPYFVLASIAVAEIMRLAALHFKDFTRGAEGILLNGIPPLETPFFTINFVGKQPFFYASLALAVIVISVNWFVQHTKLGYYFQAIREDQDAAHSLGINLTLHKNLALGISAAFTAWAGGLFALYVRFIDPTIVLGIDVSVQMVLICIIGGIGTILGPVVGSIVLVLLSETLRNPKWLVQAGLAASDSTTIAFIEARLSNAHVLFYGVLVVVVILFAPDGLLGLLRNAMARLKRRGAPPDAAPAPKAAS